MKWLLPLSLFIAGCSAADNRITIRIANWGGAGEEGPYQDAINKVNRDFEAKHPGVKVVIEGIPGEYEQKMLLNHIAGSMPDVMVLDAASASTFVDNGLMTDLSPFFEKEPGLREQYFPEVFMPFSRGRAVYGLPNDFTPMVVYYNKALFDKAKVPYPKPEWNFEEFLQTARQLTNHDKGQYGFGLTNWMPGWVMWLWNNGGDTVSPDGRASGIFDSDANVETISFLRDLATKHKVAPTLSETAALGGDYFEKGKAAMTVSGHWSLVGFRASKDIDSKQLGIAPMPNNRVAPGPRTKGTGSQTVLYLSAYGIPQHAKNKELAWEYIKAWTSYEVQSVYNKTGIAVCARKDVAADRAEVGTKPPSIEALQERSFLPIIPTGRAPYGAFLAGYSVVEVAGKSVLDTLLNNPERDVKKELTKAAAIIDREFAKRR
ncbi:MAG: sugar ABC transporter substrate-binding protein [Fimbriimonadaceae bacterium]